MDELLEWMDYIEDKRQQTKVRHKLKDIIVIVLFATLANVDDWVEMEYFAYYHEAYLKKYIELKNGIPSHDTLCRVFGMLSPEILQQLYGKDVYKRQNKMRVSGGWKQPPVWKKQAFSYDRAKAHVSASAGPAGGCGRKA